MRNQLRRDQLHDWIERLMPIASEIGMVLNHMDSDTYDAFVLQHVYVTLSNVVEYLEDPEKADFPEALKNSMNGELICPECCRPEPFTTVINNEDLLCCNNCKLLFKKSTTSQRKIDE